MAIYIFDIVTRFLDEEEEESAQALAREGELAKIKENEDDEEAGSRRRKKRRRKEEDERKEETEGVI